MAKRGTKKWKQNISKALRNKKVNQGKNHPFYGKRLSEKHKRKISRAKSGPRHHLWGKHRSKKTKEKISKANQGKNNYMYGKHHTQETIEKIKKWGRDNKEIQRKGGIKSCKKQQEMNGPTSIEKKVYDELKKRGVLFEKQKTINERFLVDVYIPSFNLIVECDGDYWHSLKKNQMRDKAKDAYLAECGFDLLRLSEMEIKNGKFIKKLKQVGIFQN